ncbi:MAG: hypothetical protein ACO1QB_12675 [Verrucomicrobiales bacterium]
MSFINCKVGIMLGLAAFTCAFANDTTADTLVVPNGSFETPETPFVDTRVDHWQKNQKPDWYDESGGFLWDQLAGVFKNTEPGQPDHIVNIDGNQALYLFAVPQAGFFQDYNSVDWNDAAPSREFNATYQPGNSYSMKVGVVGGGGGMVEGATLQLVLYYRGSLGQMVTVASAQVTHTTALFPDVNHLVDVEVAVPPVKATDEWAGKNIGIMMVSTVAGDKAGGFWDIDNVRLSAMPAPSEVPNGSFELPTTTFVDTRVDLWQKTAKPEWYDESGGFLWDQLSGVFINTAPGEPDHIDNTDGNQALYLFAVPEVGIFQDYESNDHAHTAPLNAFTTTFEPGKSYQLNVGVVGGGGGMVEGATLQLGVYYRDTNGNRVNIGSSTVTYTPENFPNTTHLVDYQVNIPVVKADDAWAGKHAGISILSTVSSTTVGGFWDLDHVRFTAKEGEDISIKISKKESNLRIAWNSVVGQSYQVQTSQDLVSWSDLEIPIAGDGSELQKVIDANQPTRFFRVVVSTLP